MKGNTPMGKLRDEAEELGIEVDGRWSNGTLTREIAKVRARQTEESARAAVPEATVTVRLLKNHKPSGWYEVVGHYDDDGVYVDGQPKPPPFPGINQEHKLWADTVVKLPAADARKLVENVASLVVTDRDPETKKAIGKRTIKTRKPLAEVQANWKELGAVGIDVEHEAA